MTRGANFTVLASGGELGVAELELELVSSIDELLLLDVSEEVTL